MATPVTKTVKPSGGDYTSLAAAETGEAKDLVAADEQLIIEIDGDWSGGADTAQVTFDAASWTVDATRYVRVYTTTTARHTGKWDTDKYILSVSSQWSGVLALQIDYMEIDGLQVEATWADAATGNIMGINCTAAEDKVSNNIVRFNGGGVLGSSDVGLQWDVAGDGKHSLWNNIVYDWYFGFFYSYGGTGNTFVLYNNTIVDNLDDGIWLQDNAGDVALYLKNNICNGNAGNDYAITAFTISVTSNNISEDATSPDVAFRSKTVIFVDTDDYRISVEDTNAKDTGTDLSADAQLAFNVDLNGKTRSGTWDIGADEYRADLVTKTISTSGGDYTSVNAFSIGEATDLVHLGQQLTAEISGTGVNEGIVEILSSDGWYSSQGNYLKITALKNGARHDGLWNTDAYRSEGTGFGVYDIDVEDIWLDGLQIYQTNIADNRKGIRTLGFATYKSIKISNCIIKGTNGGNDGKYGIVLIVGTDINTEIRIWNNIIYDWGNLVSGGPLLVSTAHASQKVWIYCNTVIGGIIGIQTTATGTNVLKDNLVQDAATNYSGTFDASSTNNLDDDGTAPGGSPQNNKTLTFVDKAGDNYDLAVTDTDAIGTGANLSADADLPITKDVQGDLRIPPWEIGAFCCPEVQEGDGNGIAFISARVRRNNRRRLMYAED